MNFKKLLNKAQDFDSLGLYFDADTIDKKVVLSELSTWEFQVDEVDLTDRHLMFNKTFLPSINDESDKIEFYVFDTFILTKDETSHLMISFEQDFTTEED